MERKRGEKAKRTERKAVGEDEGGDISMLGLIKESEWKLRQVRVG